MFVNLFVKNDNWVKENKAAFALFDDFGVGVSVISPDMEILALNKVMKKWFPEVEVSKKPICYSSFNKPPKNTPCTYCPTVQTLKDGKTHEAISETPRGDKKVNFRIVSSPVKDKNGKIIAAIEVVEDVTDSVRAASRLDKFNKCFLNFGPNPIKNINLLTALCGELLGATCALYNRIEGGTICSIGQWQAPKDYVPEDKADGHICLDVVNQAKDGILVVRNLMESKYAKSDPNVTRYKLRTYMGKAVKTRRGFVGSLCVVYQVDVNPTEDDKKLIEIIASAIAIEEERRLIGESLREKERQQEAILDNIPDIAWLKDKESRFIAVNEPLGKLSGCRPEDLVGKTDLDIWPKNLAESYRADDVEVIRTGKRKVIEEPLELKEGNVKWLETIKTPIFSDKGEVIGTTGIARDITVRRKLEFQIKESEDKFRRIFESANDAIFIADMHTGEILDVNRRAENLMGRPRKELIGINQTKLHPPEESEHYAEQFRSIIKAAKDLGDLQNPSQEAEILNSKGERVPIYISASIFELSGKKVVQGIFRDISELKRIEREKKEAEALALIDPHTQLYNYRYLQRRIHSEFELAKRRATPLSILMVDIDYFKSVNDTYGHEYGDTVLQEFAIVLQHASRGIDVVTRFEGEGFAIILPDTDEKGALAFADRIQRIIKKHRFGANKVKLRISIGICSYPEAGIATVDHLLTNADKSVRFAKEQGGDTVSMYSQLRRKKAPPVSVDADSQKRVSSITNKFMDLLRRNKQNTIEAVYALAHTVGAKNAYSEEHSEEMVKLSTEVGRKMNLTDQEIDDLKHGAMLHDIGKLGISEKILLKRGKLTKKEFETIKKHPQIGADIIRPVHFLKDVVPIILHHHERYDGYGYGSKLKGDEIPIGARIIAVVDVYQALVSNRPYRKAYSKREALKIIREESGTHFDPKIVAIFMEIVAKEKKTKK